MCGIVGYIGPGKPASILVSGLRRLEYRGYDSAGLALLREGEATLTAIKVAGKVEDLAAAVRQELGDPPPACRGIGIGHTRWATHGPPTRANAHPHLSGDRRFAVVHNGIIENYATLRAGLEREGVVFASDTDTEVIVHLVARYDDGDLPRAVARTLEQLEGAYGIAVMAADDPQRLVAARRGSPICVGLGETETLLASDISAIVSRTRQVVFLEDGDLAVLTPGNVDIASGGRGPVSRAPTTIDWDVGAIEKGGHEHFMLKEIHEQPDALANTLRGRLVETDGTAHLGGLRLAPADLARLRRVTVAACGTSFYAGMVGAYAMEDFAGMPAAVQQAAEFRYRNPIIEPDTCLVAVSQSGETADTLAAVREGLTKGATVLGVCNVVGSTIAREIGRGIYLHAGPEIGVASTKAFSCQVAALLMLALSLGRTRRLSAAAGRTIVAELARLPALAREVLDREDAIRAVAQRHAEAANAFYIGRGYAYPAALEGALKLKEISYVHAEGYHAAELKHGPIALLEEHVPVVAMAPAAPDREKTLGNIQECRARGAPVIAIASEGDGEIASLASDVIRIPACAEWLAPVPLVIAAQLFAYHVAHARGCPIDQPRNLAKSVTVE